MEEKRGAAFGLRESWGPTSSKRRVFSSGSNQMANFFVHSLAVASYLARSVL